MINIFFFLFFLSLERDETFHLCVAIVVKKAGSIVIFFLRNLFVLGFMCFSFFFWVKFKWVGEFWLQSFFILFRYECFAAVFIGSRLTHTSVLFISCSLYK